MAGESDSSAAPLFRSRAAGSAGSGVRRRIEGRANSQEGDYALWVMAARQREANEHYLVFAGTPAERWAQEGPLLRRMMESLATLPR